MSEENRAPRASEKLLAAQSLLLEMIESAAPLDEVLRRLALFLDRRNPARRCCLFVLDPEAASLRVSAAPGLDPKFGRALDALPVGSGVTGAAIESGKPVFVRDLEAEPAAGGSREQPLEHGFRACWSTPILSAAGAALGAVTLYYGRPHRPGVNETALVEAAARVAAIAIERRAAGAAREALSERFRALIESASDIVSILDAEGAIRYVSPSTERILGYGPDELVGSSGFDRVHPDDLPRARRAFQKALDRPGACPPMERKFRRRDGSSIVLEITANNRLADPAIGGVIVTGQDVTGRKDAREELLASQDRYRELFENANDIVYTHDLTGMLTSLNKAAEALTGYSREEALGLNVLAIVAPEHRPVAREMMDRKIGGEAKTTYELDILSKDGARFSLEVSTRLIFQTGKPVAIQGIARDVTERRRFESHLLQSHKMEAIGRLAGGVAHDFNNLLTVITGYSQWILDELAEDSPLSDSASEILLAAHRAAALTNQLLAFSRNQVIQPIVVDLNSLVTGLDQMLRRVIGEDVELIAATSPDLGLVKADPGQIEQVILNLAVNARDAMPGGGRLILETGNVDIGENAGAPLDCPPGPYVMLAVSDSGCGIDESIKAHIFEPFFTTKEIGKGTGLGLSTVYGIVKQGGGHIRLESEPGAGAVFRIYFPRVSGVLPAAAAPKPVSRRRGSETILLVEDETAVRRIVGEMLLRLGYTILEAPDGRAARKFMLEYNEPIQLLLTDVVMPELGGQELARLLKAMRDDLKVLFMSGYADDAIVQQGVLEQGMAYLQKPFTPDALAAKIREVLDGG